MLTIENTVYKFKTGDLSLRTMTTIYQVLKAQIEIQ